MSSRSVCDDLRSWRAALLRGLHILEKARIVAYVGEGVDLFDTACAGGLADGRAKRQEPEHPFVGYEATVASGHSRRQASLSPDLLGFPI